MWARRVIGVKYGAAAGSYRVLVLAASGFDAGSIFKSLGFRLVLVAFFGQLNTRECCVGVGYN